MLVFLWYAFTYNKSLDFCERASKAAVEDPLQKLELELRKLEIVAPHFQQLLADRLSALSRERQKWLVVWSFLCILLSKKIVTLTKATGVGIEFTSTAQDTFLLLMATGCLLLLVVFIASVYQDLRLFDFRTQPSKVALARFALLLNAESNADSQRFIEATNTLTKVSAELTELIAAPDLAQSDRDRVAKLTGLVALASDEVRAASLHLDSALNKILAGPQVQTRVEWLHLSVDVAAPIALSLGAMWFATQGLGLW